MIYLDTSAFLKLCFLETGSQTVQDAVFVQDHPLPVWDILKAEMLDALQLKVFRKEISGKEAGHLTELFDVRLRKGQYYSPEIDRYALMTTSRKMSRRTPETGCRTMDILHVACARNLRADTFISFDDRQRPLAEAVGLNLVPGYTGGE
ncbi:MAG: type II toxin-antitoxin system VapC family toxin [Spirochaetaceae bacterium]|nr:type II toxin-antitoxin system VapC family toxin [Spirochaetaceae bacterium]MDT8298171.1 type II toxin-antitoxin system VapC family toxin [Spirochaetaceae bacterium]